MVSRSNPLADHKLEAETGRADFREHLLFSLFALESALSYLSVLPFY